MVDVVSPEPVVTALQVVVSLTGIVALGVGMVVSIWSLRLQKRETVRQNERMIQLLEEIDRTLRSEWWGKRG